MDKEIEIGSDTIGKEGERVDPSHFELLKVLGQGSFGKVMNSIAYQIKHCFGFYSVLIV